MNIKIDIKTYQDDNGAFQAFGGSSYNSFVVAMITAGKTIVNVLEVSTCFNIIKN